MDKKLLRFYPSPINRRLKIFWKEGKKILNTKNANYSYDGLQEVLNKGLDRIPMEEINSVLVLGMGGGCVVDSLRRSEEHTSELQSRGHLVCRLLLEKKKNEKCRIHD